MVTPAPDRAAVLADFRIVHWTTAQGLPQNSVNGIVRLDNGEIWVATFGGLAHFDGETFDVRDMASDVGLTTNRIVSVAVAGPDAFWYLSQQGHLGKVQNGVTSTSVPPVRPSVDALRLLVDRRGHAYFKAADGTGWVTDATRPWQRLEGPDGLLQSIEEAEDGTVWAVWGSHLVNLTRGGRAAAVSLPQYDVAAFRRDGGGLWLALDTRVAQFVDDRLSRLDVRPAIGHRVTSIEHAREPDALWVAAGNEVSRLDRMPDGHWRRRTLPLGLDPQVQIRTLVVDADDNLWIGTDGSGLFRASRQPVHLVGIDAALAPVSGLAQDGAGGAFVASGCGRLSHVDAADAVRALTLRSPTDEAHVTATRCGVSLAPGAARTMWVRTGPHVFRIAPGSLQVERVRVTVPVDDGPIAAAADGGLWVVSTQGTVHMVAADGRVTRQWTFPSPLVSASVAPDGALWIGGDGQVFRLARDADAPDHVGPDEGVPRGHVRDVLVERDGTAWIGTYGGGVGRYRGTRVSRLTVVQGLPDNSVSRILDDGRGRLWVSTNRGVAVFDKTALHDVADGRLRSATPVLFNQARGVGEANFGNPAGFADQQGRLWFGTIDGAVRIDAERFPFNGTPPVVGIDAVWADDRPLAVAPLIEVPARTARVRLTFNASSLLYPELMRFKFRVDGIDPDWVDLGPQRSLSWTPPGPGRHRIAFDARNEDGIWSATPTVVEFDVLPAWWQRASVRGVGVLAVALAGLAAFRWRVRTIQRGHAQQLQRVEEQRAADQRINQLRDQLEHVSRVALVGELAASLAHEVRQPIGAMVNNAEAGRRHLDKYLQHPQDIEAIFRDIVNDGMRASEIVRGVRGFLRPHDVSLTPVDLSGLVREMLPLVRRELEDHRVVVELAMADRLPNVEGVRVQLGQVVVNLVMNACEALAGVDGPRRLTITTAAAGTSVELAVADNGPGPAAEVASRLFEAFVTTKPDGLGMGLAICRSIAEAHGGRLAADHPAGGGFRIVLSLPTATPRSES